ncbi:MAG: S-layer homology domain-containing protein, partial [Oscillospiraceae bacterium]|nr:S-layer homology domain-containing protein [Oscillospiraceae bacterium]
EGRADISIEKPGLNTAYADMDGHPACYAAQKLREEGLFVGEQVGGVYYFDPDRAVTRGEFMAMALSLTGQAGDLTPVVKTGLSDDAATPAWLKPYAAAALEAGILTGVGAPDGGRQLRASQEVTRAEAVVMLNNALGTADASALIPADWAAAPVWAQQAAINMQSAGVIDVFYDGTLRMSETVTRADAAEMLLTALNIKKAAEPNKGLLSWVFG